MMGIVQELLPSVESVEDKWHVLQLIIVFNGIIGVGFLFSTLFVGSTWGFGAGFQAFLTSATHMCYCALLVLWLRRQETSHVDFLGGIAVMMNIMLFQTAVLWSGFAHGFNTSFEGCVGSGSAERVVTAFSTILLFGHGLLSGCVMNWRQELLLEQSHEYTQINSKPVYNATNNTYQGDTESASRVSEKVDPTPIRPTSSSFAIGEEDDEDQL